MSAFDPLQTLGRVGHKDGMTKRDRLWSRYWSICEGRGYGLATPILWHLALRHDALAMTELGSTFPRPGRLSDPFSQEGLAYRAYKCGERNGAQHLAMNAFNKGDLTRYRHWLARGAKAGDSDAQRELERFETRLPHSNASRIRRRRPYRNYDFE
jgi:hypothetical protein